MFIKATFERYNKNGVEYFRIGKISLKQTVGDGRVKLISDDKEMQYAGKFYYIHWNNISQLKD